MLNFIDIESPFDVKMVLKENCVLVDSVVRIKKCMGGQSKVKAINRITQYSTFIITAEKRLYKSELLSAIVNEHIRMGHFDEISLDFVEFRIKFVDCNYLSKSQSMDIEIVKSLIKTANKYVMKSVNLEFYFNLFERCYKQHLIEKFQQEKKFQNGEKDLDNITYFVKNNEVLREFKKNIDYKKLQEKLAWRKKGN